jgi:uncharacterized protein
VAPPPSWARRLDHGWALHVRAQPRAARSEIAGTFGDALRIRLAAPANDGKANAELVRFIAETLGVARRAVTIARGQKSRDKVVEVTGDGLDLAPLTEQQP